MQLSPDISLQLHDLCKSPVASVYRNARVVLSAADGVPIGDIARVLGISVRSAKSILRAFRISGIDGLTNRGAAGRPPNLISEQRNAIIDLFRHHPSEFGIDKAQWTAADVAMVVEREQILNRISPSTVRRIVAGAGLDWHVAKRLCQRKENACDTVVADDEPGEPVQDERMTLQGLWSSVCAKESLDQERLAGIYSTLVRRYGSRDGGNHLQLELLAIHLLTALKLQESGDREGVDKSLSIIRSHLDELEQEVALRERQAGPPPGTTPAEIASDLLERWLWAQDEERDV